MIYRPDHLVQERAAPIDADDERTCTVCGELMMLVRVIPKLGGLLTLRTYQCLDCRQVETIEGDESLPMRSPRVGRAAAKYDRLAGRLAVCEAAALTTLVALSAAAATQLTVQRS
jgi:hypothetical protein